MELVSSPSKRTIFRKTLPPLRARARDSFSNYIICVCASENMDETSTTNRQSAISSSDINERESHVSASPAISEGIARDDTI